MKLIGHSQISGAGIDPRACYGWVDALLRQKDSLILPPKISIKPQEGVFCNVMPCYQVRTEKAVYGGVKVVTRYPERIPSLDSKILLLDAESGSTLALMDGNWITAMRTGAVAAHSVLTFAKSGFSVVAVMGLGNTARATLKVLLSMTKEKDLTIRLLAYKDQAEKFAADFAGHRNVTFEIVNGYEALISGADVLVSCVTYFSEDICADGVYPEGILVVPVHTRGFMNCDLFFDKVFADDTGHVRSFKYFDRFRSFAEVSDVLAGRAPGRESDSERILAYNIGIAAHDMYFASRIYELLADDPEVPDIAMGEPTEKFWV